jgi:hypothetical protein
MEGAYVLARVAEGVAADVSARLEVVVVESEEPGPPKECYYVEH